MKKSDIEQRTNMNKGVILFRKDFTPAGWLILLGQLNIDHDDGPRGPSIPDTVAVQVSKCTWSYDPDPLELECPSLEDEMECEEEPKGEWMPKPCSVCGSTDLSGDGWECSCCGTI